MALIRYLQVMSLTAFLFAGCSVIQEGEVDYSKTLAGKTIKINHKTKNTNENNCTPQTNPTPISTSRPCYEQLFRKYQKTDPIMPGETISIHLSAAFIKDYPESRSPDEYFHNQSTNAELAILVHACEQGVDGCSTVFGPNVDTVGRVVFFTNAAKRKQYLNFSYLPVYGPIEYQGKPLIVQLTIIELDVNGKQERNLIDNLAKIGEQAYPPASNVLSVLNTLGKTILFDRQHDIIFRYSMILMPDGGNNELSHPVLSLGNYIFIKKHTVPGKQEADPWREIWLDQDSGRLVILCDKNEPQKIYLGDSPCKKAHVGDEHGFQEYRGHTYLSMQVQSGFSTASLDNQQTLASLLQDLEKSRDKSYLKTNEILKSVSIEISQNNAFSDLGAPLEILKFKLNENAEQKRKDRQRTAANSYVDNLQLTLDKFITNFCGNPVEAKPPCNNLPTRNQLEQLIIETRSILISKDVTFDVDDKLPLSINNAKEFIGKNKNATDIKEALVKVNEDK